MSLWAQTLIWGLCPSESIPIGSHIKMYHLEALKSISTAKERGDRRIMVVFTETGTVKVKFYNLYLYIYMFMFTALSAAC